jgi:hypothetical protein
MRMDDTNFVDRLARRIVFDIHAWDAKVDVPPDPACFAAGIGPIPQVRESASRLPRRCAWLSRRTLRAETTAWNAGCRSKKSRVLTRGSSFFFSRVIY